MPEQLLLIGLGVGADADSAWLASGLALGVATPLPTFVPPFGEGLVANGRGGSLVSNQRSGSLVNNQRGGSLVPENEG